MRNADDRVDDAALGVADAPTISGMDGSVDTAGTSGATLGVLDLPVGTAVGRYVVVARIAAGGMGVVYLAYDPELDRRVALKVLDRPGSADHRTRALGEAQALARLSHPNVVTVHDVGTLDGRLWLAMEFVEGQTLTAWARSTEHTWREVLDVVGAAGDGLAAGHAINLAHRDFKPDNVMVARDRDAHGARRVLVTDFGLARTIADPTANPSRPAPPMTQTPVRGTPAYMAPERHRADPDDARADQFAFCVTLWETLYGERPFRADNVGALVLAVTRGEIRTPPSSRRVPRWLRRAIERGLDPDPARRWPSMVELLRHLRRGKTRARRRWIATAALAAAAAAVGVWQHGRLQDQRALQACDEQGRQIAVVWPGDRDATRERLHGAFAATGVASAAATFDRVATGLDTWTAAWSERAAAECVAAITGRDPALHAAASACLDRQQQGLAIRLEIFAEPDAEVLRRAVVAVAGLPRPELCADDADLLRRPVPAPESAERVTEVRRELERALSQEHAGRYALAQTTSDAALAQARQIGWSPLVAAAMIASGNIHNHLGDAGTAEEMLQGAYFLALAADDPDAAVDAAIPLVHVVGVGRARRTEGMVWALHAEALLARMGQSEGLRAAALASAKARVHRIGAEFDQAIAQNQRAIALRRAELGDEHPSVAAALNNLGNVYAAQHQSVEAARLFREALPIWEATVGPDHPDTAMTINNLGNALFDEQDFDGAHAHFERALEIRQVTLGADHPDVAQSLINLSAIDYGRGAFATAIERLERAATILRRARGTEHPEVSMVLANLGAAYVAIGAFDRSAVAFDEAIAISGRVIGLDHPDHARSVVQRSVLRLERGEARIAIPELESAIALFERHGGPDQAEIAEAQASLGIAFAMVGDGERAVALCRAASATRERAGVDPGAAWPPGWACLASGELARGRFVDAAAAAERALREGLEAGATPDRMFGTRMVLAEALWESPATRARAREQVEIAARDALGETRRSKALAWLDAHLR